MNRRLAQPLLGPGVVLAFVLAAAAGRARADDPGGSITGQVHVNDGDIGGGAMLDVWGTLGPLRLGGFFAVTSIPSARDWRNRTMMPAGVHISLVIDLDAVEIVLAARGGIWGGASQESKMLAGGVVGGGAYLDVALGGGISVGGGAEILGFFGGGDTWGVSPGLRLPWSSPRAEPASESVPAPDAVTEVAP